MDSSVKHTKPHNKKLATILPYIAFHSSCNVSRAEAESRASTFEIDQSEMPLLEICTSRPRVALLDDVNEQYPSVRNALESSLEEAGDSDVLDFVRARVMIPIDKVFVPHPKDPALSKKAFYKVILIPDNELDLHTDLSQPTTNQLMPNSEIQASGHLGWVMG